MNIIVTEISWVDIGNSCANMLYNLGTIITDHITFPKKFLFIRFIRKIGR